MPSALLLMALRVLQSYARRQPCGHQELKIFRLGEDAYAHLVHGESGGRHTAGRLGVGKGGPSLAHRGPGLSHFGVGPSARDIFSEYLRGPGESLLGLAAALG